MDKQVVHWETKDELEFVKGLFKKNPRAYAGYAKAVEDRKDWGRVDQWAIIDYIVEHPLTGN